MNAWIDHHKLVSDCMALEVNVWVIQTLETLDRLDLYEKLDIEWRSRFTSKMGSACFYSHGKKNHAVRFSIPLWPRASRTERRVTVIHEVCHIVAYKNALELGVHIRPHGREWEVLMLRCDVSPDRTHSVSNKGLVKRVDVNCGCGTISVTPYVAGRVAAGAGYRCRRCKANLTAPDGIRPVERRKRRRRR